MISKNEKKQDMKTETSYLISSLISTCKLRVTFSNSTNKSIYFDSYRQRLHADKHVNLTSLYITAFHLQVF